MSGGASDAPLAGRRVLIVEDMYYLATELRQIVGALGGAALGPASSLQSGQALLASEPGVDFAVLDVNLDGEPVYPVARALLERGVPFVFATGYEDWAIDPEFADVPLVDKPVTAADLAAAWRRLAIRPGAPS